MNLKMYDGKCVQIINTDDTIYEGICDYNSKDYCFHEYGRNEESLEIFGFLFYKNDIKKINIIEKFTEPFGEIEKIIVEDGISSIEDAFDREEDEHIYRVLLCLEKRELNDDIIKLLNKLIKNNKNDKIINKAKKLINKRGE